LDVATTSVSILAFHPYGANLVALNHMAELPRPPEPAPDANGRARPAEGDASDPIV
jgi:hypothetical protein